MWKLNIDFYFLENLKKYETAFCLLPLIGYFTNLYNKKIAHGLTFGWLFFVVNIVIKFEDK